MNMAGTAVSSIDFLMVLQTEIRLMTQGMDHTHSSMSYLKFVYNNVKEIAHAQ